MRLARRALFALAVLALPWPARAQVFPDIASGTVIGRVTPGVGQPEQIPLGAVLSNTTLPSGQIWIGSAGNFAAPQTPSGDWTISVLGVATLSNTSTARSDLGLGNVATQNAGTGLANSGSNLNLQAASASVIGGVNSIVCGAHTWINSIATSGLPTCTQPGNTDISGLGTGVATALGINVGTAGAFVVNGGALGTPSSGTLTNATGLPIAGLTGLGTNVASLLAANASAATWTCSVLSNAAASCSTDTTNASNISSGTLGAGRLPNPSASTLGGIESYAAVTHQWINTISTAGVPSSTQPASGDLSDVVNAGSWTPSDQSGASLVFTNVSVGYTKIGNIIFIYGRLTFPSTANGSAILIGGLPVTAANQNYASAPGVCNSNGTIGIQAQPSKNATTFFLLNSVTGASLTNANMSTLTLNCTFSYPAS